MPTDSDLFDALSDVVDPDLRRSIGELGMLREVTVGDSRLVTVGISVPNANWDAEPLGRAIAGAAKARDGVDEVQVDVAILDEEAQHALASRLKDETAIGGAGSRTRVIAVSSGKGGVGKSSVTTNTAVALARSGHDVAVIDADVWGFSIPRMLGIVSPPQAVADLIVPPKAHGVRAISMDFFVPVDQAVVWRGPMLHKALEQFLNDVYWDEPDFLLIDMPPGTGDVAISISQFLPRAQTIVVTTPQPTAQRVAKRAAAMAAKVNQEVLGVVENMSWFTGDDGKRYEIFGAGGGTSLADELEVPLLGRVPLLPAMREGADRGVPVAVAAEGSEAAGAFDEIARRIVDLRPRVRTHPELIIR
ncbi:MAG TPA: Mrp/NBP35 family ATP-binding protein [Acidimicrobiia bacterium]|nr:Mrp/NBP35 family ATP-binding protein [Acidimicrobiia bacterium]